MATFPLPTKLRCRNSCFGSLVNEKVRLEISRRQLLADLRQRVSTPARQRGRSRRSVQPSFLKNQTVGMRRGVTDEEVTAEVVGILSAAALLPRLVVFDLDYTLWPFYCECCSKRETPRLYPEAKGILNALKEKDVKMAVASRTPTPDIAQVFLNKLGLTNLFEDMEIFPSWTHKTEHFKNIHQKMDIPYNSMLFFDDEDRNIQSVGRMGVTSILVEDGVNVKALQNGLTEFAKPRTQSSSNRARG